MTIIATIRPEHLENICLGVKKREVRKTAPRCEYPVRVLLCESGSGGQIKAEFTMKDPRLATRIEFARIDKWLETMAAMACITEKDLRDYAEPERRVWFWDVNDMVDYVKEGRVRHIREFGLKRPPQSWQYAQEERKEVEK